MSFFAVDDQFHSHPKVERLIDEGPMGLQAIGLWTLVGSLSQSQLTTGLIREATAGRLVGSLPRARKLARLLVQVGLWEPAKDADGAKAYQFHDWPRTGRRTAR